MNIINSITSRLGKKGTVVLVALAVLAAIGSSAWSLRRGPVMHQPNMMSTRSSDPAVYAEPRDDPHGAWRANGLQPQDVNAAVTHGEPAEDPHGRWGIMPDQSPRPLPNGEPINDPHGAYIPRQSSGTQTTGATY